MSYRVPTILQYNMLTIYARIVCKLKFYYPGLQRHPAARPRAEHAFAACLSWLERNSIHYYPAKTRTKIFFVLHIFCFYSINL